MTRSRQHVPVLALGCLTLVAILACQPSTSEGAADEAVPPEERPLVLLTQGGQDGDSSAMEALLEGRLTAEKGCLQVDPGGGAAGYTPIWPAGYRLAEFGERFSVEDFRGTVAATQEDRVRLSGGTREVAEDLAEELRSAAEECPAPYWVVGSKIELVLP